MTDEATEALALRIARGSRDKTPLDSLSMRELQVLRRLAMGHTNREIAHAYSLSIKTVDTYRARLLKKAGFAQQRRTDSVCHSKPPHRTVTWRHLALICKKNPYSKIRNPLIDRSTHNR